MPTAVRLADVVAALGGALHGDGSLPIQRLAPLESADAGSMSFLANPRYAAKMAASAAGCVIVAPAQQELALARGAAIVTPDPYLYFARLTQWWAARTRPAATPGVHPSAVVEPGAHIHPSACVGALAYVGSGARIGAGAVVGTHGHIGAGAVVAPGKVVEPGSLWVGNPARFIRRLSDVEIESLYYSAQNYRALKDEYLA